MIKPTHKPTDLAVSYAIDFKGHLTNAVYSAILCGRELAKVKQELPHGEYTNWVLDNMPIDHVRCARFVKLAKSHPNILPGDKTLSLAAELLLTRVIDDGITRKEAIESDMTTAEVDTLVKEAQLVNNSSEDLDEPLEPGSTQTFLDKHVDKSIKEVEQLDPFNGLFKEIRDLIRMADPTTVSDILMELEEMVEIIKQLGETS